MPAGDLITADNQIEVNGILFGTGQTWTILTWPDFFRIDPKDADLPLLGDGSYLGRTYSDVKRLAWNVQTLSRTQSTLLSRKNTLLSAWDQQDAEIHWREGGTHYSLEGQTRRFAVEDRWRASWGRLVVTLEFVANPTRTTH